MTNKEIIAKGLAEIEERNKEIDRLIAELKDEKYNNELRKGDLEGWLLEINAMDGEDPWTW